MKIIDLTKEPYEGMDPDAVIANLACGKLRSELIKKDEPAFLFSENLWCIATEHGVSFGKILRDPVLDDSLLAVCPNFIQRIMNLQEPSVADLAKNFGGALSRWFAAGLPIVSKDEYARRAKICDSCPHWDAAARAGLGKCKHKKCGCTSFKRWLATEKCPIGKWDNETQNEESPS